MKQTQAWWSLQRQGFWRLRLPGVWTVMFMLLAGSGFPVDAAQSDMPGATPRSAASPVSSSVPGPMLPAPMQGTVRRGQSTYGLLREAGVSIGEIATLQRAVRQVYDISRLQVGQPYRIEVLPDGQLQRFVYEVTPTRQFVAERQDSSFVGRLLPVAYSVRERVIQGTIQGALYDALAEQGEPPEVAADLAEIFAWQVDFHTDLRRGDTFRVLIEEYYRDNQRIGYGRILAAELINRQRVFQAIYYAPPARKQQGAYYRPDGRAMRRMFLRSPLRYQRISSRFSYRRFHPVLKRYRPHLGVDYAAPRGTPVRSMADGVVQWVGRKGANGKMIRIKHPHGYMTYYLHLSRYARGLRAGKRIKQGQVIGYVGSTGLSTGPHLDFRITRNGKFLNPLRLNKHVAALPLSRRLVPAFQSYAARLLAKLPQIETAVR